MDEERILAMPGKAAECDVSGAESPPERVSLAASPKSTGEPAHKGRLARCDIDGGGVTTLVHGC